MACPHFHPSEPLAAWRKPPLLPLGDPYAGTCHAEPASAVQPELAVLREFCNLGYARGRCPRFPANGGPDAVRFGVTHDRGGRIGIWCVRERDHLPFDEERLEYSVEIQAFTSPPRDAALGCQAEAYLASYLRRTARSRKES